VLDDIIDGVRIDLDARREAVSLDDLELMVASRGAPLDPMPAFRRRGLSIIAEVKRRSPSKGHLAEIPEPAALAAEYEAGGASAISVLTEERRFAGSLADLDAVRERVSIPCYARTSWSTRTRCGRPGRTVPTSSCSSWRRSPTPSSVLALLAQSLGMTCLVEVHTAEEVARAVDSGAVLLGVTTGTSRRSPWTPACSRGWPTRTGRHRQGR